MHTTNLRAKFHDSIGDLRDKGRYDFNEDGEVDYQVEDLITLVSEIRYSVSRVDTFFRQGLSTFGKTPSGCSGTYFPTQTDQMFFYYVDDAFMRIYNAWNRIGNLLNTFFPVRKRNVYFTNVMDSLAENPDLNKNTNFRSLLDFRSCGYKEFNSKRNEIVHNTSSSAEYFSEFVNQNTDAQALARIQEERDSLPQFLEDQYCRLLKGIDEMLEVIKKNVKRHS